ncbi:MAG: DUF4874 domain-containing protein [Oscillospiraceae bacterium]
MPKKMKNIITSVFSHFAKAKSYNIKEYPAIKKEFQCDICDNLKICGMNEELLKNPDRGFRGEVYITLGSLSSYGGMGNAYERLNSELELYKSDSIMLVQCYVYLSEYYKKPLDEKALGQLKDYLKEIEKKNVRILLRFAYEYERPLKMGASTEIIEKHCKQLKAFFAENIDLFNKTVYAVQLGMIGLWGEGHSETKKLDYKRVIEAVTDMFPKNVAIMMRKPDFYEFIPDGQDIRFTVHDDFLVGIYHEWGMIPFDHPQYNNLLLKNQYNLADGEMPWGRDNTVPNIDGKLLLKQIAGYGLTSLSITHNYKEENKTFDMQEWKSEYLYENDFKELSIAFNPKMLKDGKISIFDYIKYHLGYQLAVSNFNISSGKLHFIINNFGFSAPHEFDLVYVVNNCEFVQNDFDKMRLSAFGQLKVECEINDGDSFGIMFRHKRDASLTIKLANDLPYENGINLLLINNHSF